MNNGKFYVRNSEMISNLYAKHLFRCGNLTEPYIFHYFFWTQKVKVLQNTLLTFVRFSVRQLVSQFVRSFSLDALGGIF